MSVGPLFTVFGLLLCRATTVSASDILLFLGLGLYLVVLFARTTATTEVNAILQNLLEITLLTHISNACLSFNPPSPLGGVGGRLLVVEQSHAREGHGDAILVAGHDDMVVTDRAASLGNEFYTALVGTLNVVAEGEESIRA